MQMLLASKALSPECVASADRARFFGCRGLEKSFDKGAFLKQNSFFDLFLLLSYILSYPLSYVLSSVVDIGRSGEGADLPLLQ